MYISLKLVNAIERYEMANGRLEAEPRSLRSVVSESGCEYRVGAAWKMGTQLVEE